MLFRLTILGLRFITRKRRLLQVQLRVRHHQAPLPARLRQPQVQRLQARLRQQVLLQAQLRLRPPQARPQARPLQLQVQLLFQQTKIIVAVIMPLFQLMILI